MHATIAAEIDAHLWDETLLYDKIADVKGPVAAPAKADEAFASEVVDEAILNQERANGLENLRKWRCSINLFLWASQ